LAIRDGGGGARLDPLEVLLQGPLNKQRAFGSLCKKGHDMRKLYGLVVGLVAMGAMLVGATSATATETATISPGHVTAHADHSLILGEGAIQIDCLVLLGATLRNVVELELDDLTKIGRVVSGSTDECNGADHVGFLNLPATLDGGPSGPNPNSWDIAIVLPLPAGGGANIQILDAQIEVLILGGAARCLYRGAIDATLNAAGTQLTIDDDIPLFSAGGIFGGLCPDPGHLQGTIDILDGPITIALS
jgi:hypothetical protein